jgi:outer membrane biosynthesis protein TonB
VTRREISPALLGSLALHLAAAAALLVSWPFTRDLKLGSVVPVTIVANAPPADLRAALQAPETQAAQTEQPVPDAPPELSAPQPQPEPTPPKADQTHKPVEQPQKSLDLDSLAASLTKLAKPASAARGAARPETATQARPALGSAAASSALAGLTEELQRRWNPNCDVAEARAVVVRVTFTLNSGGGVQGEVQSQIRGPQTAAGRAAAQRAVSAVYAAAPFRTLPREFYGQPIGVNFDAQQACS